jgi:hypothetical protein
MLSRQYTIVTKVLMAIIKRKLTERMLVANLLKEQDVIGWLEAGLDVEAMQTSIEAQIENLKNPPIVNLGLPWQNEA